MMLYRQALGCTTIKDGSKVYLRLFAEDRPDFFAADFFPAVVLFPVVDFLAPDRFAPLLLVADLLAVLFFAADFLAPLLPAADLFLEAFFGALRFAPLPAVVRALFFRGTFAPDSLASDKPMAMACFGLVTFLPLRPDLSLPVFISCIARSTLSCDFLEYFAIVEYFQEEV